MKDYTQLPPPQFSQKTLDLYNKLNQVNESWGNMLRGVHYALRDQGNPEMYVQAAQSARELINSYFDIKIESEQRRESISQCIDSGKSYQDCEDDFVYTQIKMQIKEQLKKYRAGDIDKMAERFRDIRNFFTRISHHNLSAYQVVQDFSKNIEELEQLLVDTHPTLHRLHQLTKQIQGEESRNGKK